MGGRTGPKEEHLDFDRNLERLESKSRLSSPYTSFSATPARTCSSRARTLHRYYGLFINYGTHVGWHFNLVLSPKHRNCTPKQAHRKGIRVCQALQHRARLVLVLVSFSTWTLLAPTNVSHPVLQLTHSNSTTTRNWSKEERRNRTLWWCNLQGSREARSVSRLSRQS